VTTRQKLHAEIDTLDEQSVDAVYEMVRQYATSQAAAGQRQGDLLKMLQQIEIRGPADWSENLDDYLYHGKKFPDDVS